ncbi:rcc01693 family protein [Ancylobacter koreensis]
MTGGAALPRAFPWAEAMAFGLGRLQLSPRDFWRMTPRELAAALGPTGPVRVPLGRAALDALMARFPD